MPEILTKHPDAVIKLLMSVGAKCGTGEKPQILTQCTRKNFCVLPSGEFCVYGLDEMSTMTQIHKTDFAEFVGQTPTIYSWSNVLIIMVMFLIGLGVGMLLNKR